MNHKAKETGSWANDKTRDVMDSVSSGHALQVSMAAWRAPVVAAHMLIRLPMSLWCLVSGR